MGTRDAPTPAELDAAEWRLELAIYELTGTLEYEWDGEWRAEIEELNKAHGQLLSMKQRIKRSQQAP